MSSGASALHLRLALSALFNVFRMLPSFQSGKSVGKGRRCSSLLAWSCDYIEPGIIDSELNGLKGQGRTVSDGDGLCDDRDIDIEWCRRK